MKRIIIALVFIFFAANCYAASSAQNYAKRFPTDTAILIAPLSGATTDGDCVKFDNNGNIIDAGAPCGSGGGGGTPGGNNHDIQYLVVSGTVRSFAGNDGLVYDGANVGIGTVSPHDLGSGFNYVAHGGIGAGQLTIPQFSSDSHAIYSDGNGDLAVTGSLNVNGFSIDSTGFLFSPTGGEFGGDNTFEGDIFGNGIEDQTLSSGLMQVGDPFHINNGTVLKIDSVSNTFEMNASLNMDAQINMGVSGISDENGLLGTNGQVLTSQGSALLWVTPSASSGFWVAGNVGINTTSNVGIGSIAPGQKLDVQGNVRATGFIGNGSGLTNISLTTGISGILPIANGGTNATTNQGAANNIGVTAMSGGNIYIDPINNSSAYSGQLANDTGFNTNSIFGSGSTAQGAWRNAFNFLSGVQGFGVNPSLGQKMAPIDVVSVNLLGDPAGMVTSGDSELVVTSWSDSPSHSGGGLCTSVMSDGGNGMSIDLGDNESCITQEKQIGLAGLIPGWTYYVANSDNINNKGFAIASATVGPDSDNYSFFMADFVNKLDRFPKWNKDTVQASDTGVISTVTLGAGGSGYTQNDVLGITQGSATNGLVIASTVSGGVVTAITLDCGELIKNGGCGNGYSVASGLATTTGMIFLANLHSGGGGIGYRPGDPLTIVQSGGSGGMAGVASVDSKIVTIAVNSGGTNYQVGDVVTVAQAPYEQITFTNTAANATIGATYTNNLQTCTVLKTIASGTTLYTSCTGNPLSSGTLTKASGTGDATITFSTYLNHSFQNIIFTPGLGSATVATLSGSAIATLTLTGPGYGYYSANGLAVTGGHGSGATVNITAGVVQSVLVTQAGVNYQTATALATTGGSGTGATVDITAKGHGGSGATVNITAITNYQDVFTIDPVHNTFYADPTNDNIPFGFNTLQNVTTGASLYAIGTNAQLHATTAVSDVAIGDGALSSNHGGSAILAIGTGALQSFNDNSVADIVNMTAIGSGAMTSGTSGVNDTCVGGGCMGVRNGTLGNNNTCVGGDCLANAGSGDNNTSIGASSCRGLASGASNNTCLGNTIAYSSLTTGSGNILIGQGIDAKTTSMSNALSIGNLIQGTGLTQSGSTLTTGGTVSIGGNVGIGSSFPGQALDVQGTIRVSTLGSTIAVASGTNGCQGQATLSSGVVTVSTACTPATSQGIFLTDAQTSLTNVGSVTIGTVTAGSSFVVQSTNILDSSKVNWWVIKSQ